MKKNDYQAMRDFFDRAEVSYEEVTRDIDHLRREYRVPSDIQIDRVVEMEGGKLFFFDGADKFVEIGGTKPGDLVEYIGRDVPSNANDGAPTFPYIEHPRYGKMPAPQTFGELLTYLESVSGQTIVSGWRGQADIGWRLDSTAARRVRLLRESSDSDYFEYWGTLEEVVRQYEQRLIAQARMAGHGLLGGRSLTDLELLSVLQHYGAATRLLDFTRNVFVALWFACRGHEDRHGLLMGITTRANRSIRTEDDLKKPVPQLLDALRPEVGEFFYAWEPRYLFERMRVQQSLFVFGKAEDLPSGSAPFVLSSDGSSRYDEEGGGHLMLLAVPPCLKAEVVDKYRPRLKEFLGYDARALFPDIEGFSAFHAAGEDPEAMFLD